MPIEEAESRPRENAGNTDLGDPTIAESASTARELGAQILHLQTLNAASLDP
jgi:hypothetical protein